MNGSDIVQSLARLAVPVGLLLLLAGCGPDYSPNTYAGAAAQQANKVERGVVVGVRPVDINADATGGAVVGGAAGGIAGSQSPGGAVGAAFGALGGTVVGGLVGAATEHATTDTTAFEYVVRTEPKGDLVSVTQKDTTPLALGQKVLVIEGKQARVVPDYTVQLPPDAATPPAKAEPPKPAPPPDAAAPPAPPVTAAPLPPATPAPSPPAEAHTVVPAPHPLPPGPPLAVDALPPP